jgi:hypothetical protein
VIDARKKPSLPEELVVRDDIAKLVDSTLARILPERHLILVPSWGNASSTGSSKLDLF